MTELEPAFRPRRRRADGERTRHTILSAAAELATVEGLEGLSIARLAEHIGMSKSGLYAHFGSKEELQLATVEMAGEIFVREVVEPGLEGPEGIERLFRLCDAFLSYVERRVFPGGCFFASAAAELDTHPGRVRERVRDYERKWAAALTALVGDAQRLGELDVSVDAEQLVFELNSFLLGANAAFLLEGDSVVFARAQTAVRRSIPGRGGADGPSAARALSPA